jgi:hypothetical protein
MNTKRVKKSTTVREDDIMDLPSVYPGAPYTNIRGDLSASPYYDHLFSNNMSN